MSVISSNIPVQGFEIVRDAIGAILKIELENQKALKGITLPIDVFIGRSTPFHHSEVLMLNVHCENSNYSHFHENGVHGLTNYYIDISTSAKEDAQNDGGYNSTLLRDQFLGMCRYILQDHHYKTLGLSGEMVNGTYVNGFENFETSNSQDSSFVKVSRISFSVRIYEDQSLWEGVNISSTFTDVKLDDTNLGYKYEFNI